MSLPDYYIILQIATNATYAEIKAAYRRLAKLYHPDRNSGGYADEEKFKQVKEAYETLIHPQKRARYDAKRNRATTFGTTSSYQQKKPAQKNYSFTEEEAKRRQYYQQQYKKTQSAYTKKKEPEPTKQQNELKYILISVPVAVALLLLIIRFYEKPAEQSPSVNVVDTSGMRSDINTPEIPYKGLFGRFVPDTASASVIRIANKSGYDAVIFLQNDSLKTIRNHFIANNYQLLLENIPTRKYNLYYWLGKGFSYKQFLFDTIMGNYKESAGMYKTGPSFKVSGEEGDTLTFMLQKKEANDSNTIDLKTIFTH